MISLKLVSSQIISKNIKNINNSGMKNTGNMKEKVNNNVDSKQIKENSAKDVRTEEKIICNVSENRKNVTLKKI